MQLKKILVPTDFSQGSSAAIEWAASLARDHNAMLMIVHVRENPGGVGDEASGINRNEVYLHRLLQQSGRAATGVGWSQHLLEGDAGEQIVRFAAEQQVDLIVLGTHGRQGLMRLLMGSVAESVLRRATCPVLTVKQRCATP
ncbi:MAG: universal stress protein [Planctomycetes bacterium]|nr:universal stress protein [Planctomycetota bacterium]